jgi:hypothetical protein
MVALDLALIEQYDEQLRVLEQDLAMKAKAHDAYAYQWLALGPWHRSYSHPGHSL